MTSPFELPQRFADATFATYQPRNASQQTALADARTLAELIRKRYTISRWKVPFNRELQRTVGDGLYLVGPVGTGKTHLLAGIYHTLHPTVPCAFMHSSRLFRARSTPEDYAAELARQYRVLLLDEVELDDPANEIRLIGVLKTLRKLGVTVAATSNAEPEKFLSAQFGRDRLERFISEEFRKSYHVVFVGGEDFRRVLAKPGRAWVGPTEETATEMCREYDADPRHKIWLSSEELLHRTITTERDRLVAEIGSYEAVYLADLAVTSSNDALRLLRVVDDLYDQPNPPAIYFTSEQLPENWFRPQNSRAGIDAAVAEKFARTVSRLHAMAQVSQIGMNP